MTFSNRRQSEKGNILFLILLAVILFAALSYAVTQSLRGGGTDASNERNLVKGAQITQYPVGVRAAILRMIIDGDSVTLLNFDAPSVFANVGYDATDQSRGVFHPNGGGAVFSLVPSEALATASSTTRWIFTRNFGIPNIGVAGSTSTDTGKDLVAMVNCMDGALCSKINSEIGLNGTLGSSAAATTQNVPEITSVTLTGNISQLVEEYTYSQTATANFVDGTNTISNQPYACVQNGDGGSYVYYHVLVER